MSNDIARILTKFDQLNEGLNQQQTAVKQMPALFKMKSQGPVLGGDPNRPAPSKGYYFGGEGGEPTVNRGGYNRLRDRKDYLDKRDILFRQLTPGIDPQTREAIKDRLAQLEKAAEMSGLTEDTEDNPMRDAVIGRIGRGRMDLVEKYGLEAVMDAVDDVTEGDTDWEEIGSSDVSAYIKRVEDLLRDRGGDRPEMDDRRPFAENTLNEVTQGVEHSEWADNVKDAYHPATVRIIKKRTEDGRHVKSHAMMGDKLVGQYNMNTGVGTFTQPPKQGVSESATTEDVVSAVKKKLGDYLQDVATAIKKDPDLMDKLPQTQDRISPVVKTITTDDGKEIKIHGNEDDGFRITIKNKALSSKFDNLDEAVMACEMYCARRRNMQEQTSNNDYLEER